MLYFIIITIFLTSFLGRYNTVNEFKSLLFVFFVLVLPVIILYRIGKPSIAEYINESLWLGGLANHTGEPPLLKKIDYKHHRNMIVIYTFFTNGVSKLKFENNIETIEEALNCQVVKI